MFFGIWCIIGNILTPLCIVAGIWQVLQWYKFFKLYAYNKDQYTTIISDNDFSNFQMLAGFASIVIEAPFCCFCVPGAQDAVAKLDGRPLWQKGALYLM